MRPKMKIERYWMNKQRLYCSLLRLQVLSTTKQFIAFICCVKRRFRVGTYWKTSSIVTTNIQFLNAMSVRENSVTIFVFECISRPNITSEFVITRDVSTCVRTLKHLLTIRTDILKRNLMFVLIVTNPLLSITLARNTSNSNTNCLLSHWSAVSTDVMNNSEMNIHRSVNTNTN